MVRVVVVSFLLALVALVACIPFDGVGIAPPDAAKEGGVTDAPIGQDGGPTFCQRETNASTVFCEDFDSDPKYPAWTRDDTDPTAKLALVSGRSPPNALEFSITAGPDGSPDANIFRIGPSVDRVELSMNVRFTSTDDGGFGSYVILRNQADDVGLRLRMNGAIVESTPPDTFSQIATAPIVPLNEWTPVRIALRYDVVPATMEVRIGEKTPVNANLDSRWRKADLGVRVGLESAKTMAKSWRVEVDDIHLVRLAPGK